MDISLAFRVKVTLLLAYTMSLIIITSDNALAGKNEREITAKPQTLFMCRADKFFLLKPSNDGTSGPDYAVSGRRDIRGEVRLTIDANDHTMAVIVRYRGKGTKTYTLTDVEQRSRSGSGASGYADTVIRGKSGDRILTLFAESENYGFTQNAALQVEGPNPFFLTCAPRNYKDFIVKGVGRYGLTNIYVLSSGDLAKKMDDLPREPDLDEHH